MIGLKRIVLASLLGLALAGCTSSPAEEGHVIEGHASSFQPADLRVAVGQPVTFEMVQFSHTVDFSEGDGGVAGVSDAHSGNLDPGDTFHVTFTEARTYPYFCRYHSSVSGGERVGMVGTITVE